MQPKVMIASKSILASNIYKLLLAKRRPNIVTAQKFEDVRSLFFRPGIVDLAIFHSDVFTPKFDSFLRYLKEDKPFSKTPKIFVCKSDAKEKEWQNNLKKLPKSFVIERPFDPVDFEKIVSGVFHG